MYYDQDTIAALATAPGTGGIAIVRISGPDAEELLRALFVEKRAFETRKMAYGHVAFQGQVLDECMAVMMRAPHSYTREDVAEIHLHGGSYAAGHVLRALYQLGARPAEAGEFTRRAFLNGRIDLSQAEAVMGIIGAEGDRSARAAVRQLSGGVNRFISFVTDELLALLAGVEAAIDYPEEVSDEEAYTSLEQGALALAERLESACDERGARLMESGLNVVLCGRPNVGKSSLLNALLQEERAIVTDIPGTTRDIVSGSFQLSGVKINLSDTAGLRHGAEQVEQIGIDRARQAIAGADVALVVLDASVPLTAEDERLMQDTAGAPRIVLYNKCDLASAPAPLPEGTLRLSARTGEGMDDLRRALSAYVAHAGQSEITQERHMALCRQAAASLRSAAEACAGGASVDLAAVDLHDALQFLGRITGAQMDEKLLDDIFSRFCVGK